jgi:hypothetical protein
VRNLPRFLAAVLATALLAAPAASAESAFAPKLSSPGKNKVFTKGKKITFKAKLDSGSSASSVFIIVSKSKKVDADGLLPNKTYMRQMKRRGSTYQHVSERYPALSSYWLNKPGKYYWQAYAIDCSDGTGDCSVESEIRSFRIR